MRRTTLALDERIYERIKAKARREHRHFQDCANDLLRLGLGAEATRARVKPKPLPVLHGGRLLVDVADREALYDVMERE
jgi:hypothetical protein